MLRLYAPACSPVTPERKFFLLTPYCAGVHIYTVVRITMQPRV